MNGCQLAWADEEFGGAALGSRRRTARLVKMAAQVAALPGGRITEVFLTGAEREGAFRFVENDSIPPASVAAASHAACARRAAEYPFVFVPVDGSSLNISDWARAKGLGVVGSRSVGATGMQVMSAIGVAPTGVPLGVCGQLFWVRRGRVRKRGRHDTRNVASKESSHWLTVISGTESVFAHHAPTTQPWFQLDRGGDAWAVLDFADRQGVLVTVRANHDRRLWSAHGRRKYLRSTLRRTPVRSVKYLEVPATPTRTARTARMELRFSSVTIDLHKRPDGRQGWPATFSAVWVRESGTAPRGEPPIEWLLLTTHLVEDIADAELVVDGYAMRWTIEEFHRAWKSGVCHVERTQLRSCDHILRWATILAAVAARAIRLAKLVRSEPHMPATAEFSAPEIEAALIATRRKAVDPAAATLGEIVRSIAELGGYIGKASGGPPGASVIARGLDRMYLLAQHLAGEEK